MFINQSTLPSTVTSDLKVMRIRNPYSTLGENGMQ